MDPTQAQVSYWLATILLGQQKDHPEKTPLALYDYARAAAYDGPNSLPAASRPAVLQFFQKAYGTYHGSPEGADKILAAAKTSAMPPPELKITSTVDVAKANAEAEAEKAKAMGPMLALWLTIKTALTGDAGQAYFDMSMKDAGLPGGVNGVTKFKGKLISMTPANRPKTLVLGIEKPDAADVTLNLDEALPGKMEPGGDIEFEGVATGFTKEPFMVTFDVEKDKLSGWTGKNAPAAKKAAPKKKAQ
jgi:hypothetical protein